MGIKRCLIENDEMCIGIDNTGRFCSDCRISLKNINKIYKN